MIFHDRAVDALDPADPFAIQELIEVHLCGHPTISKLSNSDLDLLTEFVQTAGPAGISFQQLNELLLVLNQDRVSRAFFQFFFGDPDTPLTMVELKRGVIKFKGFAMSCFGNFRFAYRKLIVFETLDQIASELGPCCRPSEEVEKFYSSRAPKVLDTTVIPRDQTWYVGEITGNLVETEIKSFEEYRRQHPEIASDTASIIFAKRLTEMDEEFNRIQAAALRNTDIYLTWDYLDIYVATSMRNRWEYEEVFDFTHDFFAKPILAPLNLRYFDPTQSKCATARDKGLLEGLMLKRADCTIYMAQETDTLGKDSELANTLAQGKPVIAYVPKIAVTEFAKTIANRPLAYVKQRLLHLQAAGLIQEVDGLARLTEKFQADLTEHRSRQPFELWEDKDASEFKAKKDYWSQLCNLLAEAESRAFDKRAQVLQKYHPLGMQMNLQTGVANGVLVARSLETCADLLFAILTNKTEFDVEIDKGGRVLIERNSESAFRAVTNNEKLTNSFWNLWNAKT